MVGRPVAALGYSPAKPGEGNRLVAATPRYGTMWLPARVHERVNALLAEGALMSLEGTIVNGRVEFDESAHLPEGARVRVELLPESSASKKTAPDGSASSPLAQRLLALAGRAKGLPSDMARNHDHYIHGTRKR